MISRSKWLRLWDGFPNNDPFTSGSQTALGNEHVVLVNIAFFLTNARRLAVSSA